MSTIIDKLKELGTEVETLAEETWAKIEAVIEKHFGSTDATTTATTTTTEVTPEATTTTVVTPAATTTTATTDTPSTPVA